MEYEIKYNAKNGGVITKYAYSWGDLILTLAEINRDVVDNEDDQPEDLKQITVNTIED